MGAPSVASVQQYKDAIYLLAQQLESRTRPLVMVDTNFVGVNKFYDQYGTDSMVEISTRYQDTPVQLPNHSRRMISPRFFVSNTLEDPTDALQMIIDPKSTYMQAKKAAAERQLDDLVIGALGGTSYTGVAGGTSVALPAASILAGTANVGMTKAMCISSKRKLDAAEVDKEDRFMLHSAAQLQDLLLTTEVSSSDYNIVKPLYEGDVDKWLGFKWVHSERLLQDGTSTYRCCYAFQKKGIQLAIQKDIEGRVDERPDKNYAWQVYLKMCMNATRLEEVRVVQVQCAELAS